MYRSLIALVERVGAPSGGCDAGPLTNLEQPPEPLIRAVEDGSCFLLTGEELSRSSGVPGWTECLEGLIGYLRDRQIIGQQHASDLEHLLQTARFDRLAELMRKTVVRWDQHMMAYAEDLYSSKWRRSQVLETLGAVPFCAGLTPNLDSLLESTLGWETLDPGDGLTVQDRLAESLPFVLKLRGVARRSGITVWPDEAAARLRNSCGEALRDLFSTRTMLAFGIPPPELQIWLEAAAITRPDTTHYLITTSCDPHLRRKAELLYRKFHVEVLLAADVESPEVLAFLQRLIPRRV